MSRLRAAPALGFVAFLAMSFVGCVSGAGPRAAPAGRDGADDARGASALPQVETLDALLEPIRREYGLPALAAAVTRRCGLIAVGAVGVRSVASDEPVARHDRFHIGSAQKH